MFSCCWRGCGWGGCDRHRTVGVGVGGVWGCVGAGESKRALILERIVWSVVVLEWSVWRVESSVVVGPPMVAARAQQNAFHSFLSLANSSASSKFMCAGMSMTMLPGTRFANWCRSAILTSLAPCMRRMCPTHWSLRTLMALTKS